MQAARSADGKRNEVRPHVCDDAGAGAAPRPADTLLKAELIEGAEEAVARRRHAQAQRGHQDTAPNPSRD